MELIHDTGSLSIRKNADGNAGFLLTNKMGNYCSFFNEPTSRYYGLFYFDEKRTEMYKFIDSIEVKGGSITSLKNYFYFAQRKKDKIIESFLMPSCLSSLMYWLSAENEIDLILDCKGSYDNRQWGRYYEIFEEDGCLIIKFTKKTDEREDASHGVEEFALHLAIKCNNSQYKKNDEWVEREYSCDEERNSPPFKRYVYNALRLKGSRFVFSMSKDKAGAIEECINIFNKFESLKSAERRAFLDFLKNDSVKSVMRNRRMGRETKLAYINALNSLNKLAVSGKASEGIFAGLPWFFQFWPRDTLISLKALSKINKEFSERILFSYLKSMQNDGRLPKLIAKNFSGENFSDNIYNVNADSHGWLFFRCSEMVDKMGEKESEYHRKLYEIESSLEKSLSGLLKFHTSGSFESSNAKETWMDTEFGNDKREGACIEIQALRLNMYRLMHWLSQNHKYSILESLLKAKLRQEFFNGKIIADCLNDWTARPNIFIAAYVYPEFLSPAEWETCIGNALKSLWLGWGGLSTIDKGSALYTDAHTGENAKSYHRGDSWFWINNMAALTLFKTNKENFKNEIKKIIEASTGEILWKGCIGCHSELSSAKELSSKGCFAQAWSNAMYVEMIDEVFVLSG